MSTRRFTAIAAFQQIFCRENPKAVFPIEIVGVKLFSALKNFAHLCYMKFKGTIPIQKIDELNGNRIDLISYIQEVNEKRLVLTAKLGEKYGDRQVDLETGELK